ncbi:S8 family serine peptidase [Streptomyces rhizosphaerihabitans]|uniref:S8 family serine peptidase n=1 Tax=Streptomyces rhizosphaerihabitans TaxID=1266770 RepID=UPI0021BFAEB2|nr:S8 family serine peptidase [Streptomyces rhizosphaerihabitans]MCT9008046.1 S8 family serine peptidase [Streptomyces rhizosphaerihabitans]
MKRTSWMTVVTAMTAISLSAAIPAQASAPPSPPTAAEATPATIDPPLYDKTANGGKVRVNVLTKQRADLSAAADTGKTVQTFETLPLVTVKVDQAGLEKLAAQSNVVSVTEDTPVPPSLNESVPLIGGTSPAAAGLTGAGSAIAVLDTGVATHHPFLKGRVVAEACFSPIDADYSATSLCPNGTEEQEGTGSADSETGPCATITECDHGTHVAGIAAGNGEGITGAPARGVAPGADIVAIQVFSEFTSEDYCGAGAAPCVLSFTSAQLSALEKVWELKQSGIPLVAANLSLGSGRYTTACEDDPHQAVIDQLLDAGVATVVAAGNNGYTDAVSSPACVSSALAVGATTDDDELAAFTNRGPLVDVFAPGTSIVSSVPGGGYASKAGTSMAAPHVAGALAVLRQAFPTRSIESLEALLKTTGKPITYTGASTPRIDIGQALSHRSDKPGDFNGDGRSDAAYLYDYGANSDGTSHSALWLQTSNGSGFNNPVKQWDSGTGSWNWSLSKTLSGDFNGDGNSDAAVLYKYADTSDGRGHSALWTFTSTGTDFNNPVKVWDSGTGDWDWDNSELVAGDFNGDGKSDVGALYKYANTSDGRGHSALWTFTSTGAGFNKPVKLWDSGTGSWTADNSKLVAGDFNGDGKSDVGALYKYADTSDGRGHSALWTFTSTGAGFNKPVKLWDSDTGDWHWDNSELVAGDFNGDGKSDVGALYKYANTSDGRGHSALWTFTSNGAGFNKPVKLWDSGTGSWTADNSKLVAGDFNGDGKSDVGALYKYANTSDGRGHSALWTFTSTGTDFNNPVKVWDSGTGSWTWDRTKTT